MKGFSIILGLGLIAFASAATLDPTCMLKEITPTVSMEGDMKFV